MVHLDYCSENIVWRRPARLFVIDNATLSLGDPAEDLARTWYRWNMDARSWRAFLAGYASLADPQRFLDHFPFWAGVTLVRAARYRMDIGAYNWHEPVSRLVELAALLRSGGALPAELSQARFTPVSGSIDG
jgi:aminoglycoside phosphotransferase (APT) family kinase protein